MEVDRSDETKRRIIIVLVVQGIWHGDGSSACPLIGRRRLGQLSAWKGAERAYSVSSPQGLMPPCMSALL